MTKLEAQIEATQTALGEGERRKARIARRLRAETTMRLGWIAERLRMGSASMVAHCLRKRDKDGETIAN